MDTKIEEIRGKFVTSSWGSSMGGFGEGFGWIWRGFWEGFEGLWEARGARLETKMEEIRGRFATMSQDGSRGGFGEDLGRIWKGFCKDLEGFREDREGFGGLWEARGARMETKMEEIRGHFVILSSSWSDCEDSWGILEHPSES